MFIWEHPPIRKKSFARYALRPDTADWSDILLRTPWFEKKGPLLSFRIIRKTRAIHCNSVRRKSTPKWLTVIALANNGNDIFLSSLVLLQQHWILISPWDQQEVTESQAYLCFGLELWGKGWGGDEEVWSRSSCLVWKHMPQGARLAE